MKRLSTLLVACGSLALAATGCIGELDPVTPDDGMSGGTPVDPNNGTPTTPNGGDPAADDGTATPGAGPDALFAAVAQPIATTCGGPACHAAQAPTFVPADPAAFTAASIKLYSDTLFVNYDPATAKLLINGQGGHYGVTFTPEVVTGIQSWLTAEKDAVAAGGATTVGPLAAWSGCMELADFQAENVGGEWANKGTNQGDCEQCHNLAGEGFLANDNNELTFINLTKDSSLLDAYFTIDQAGAVMINRPLLEQVGLGQEPFQTHPRFNVDNGNAMQALQRFYDLTKARQDAGQCGPSKIER